MTGATGIGWFDRWVMSALLDSIREFRVTIVNGPRQSGKTVLLGQLNRRIGGSSVTFDDPEILASAIADPVGFVTHFRKPLLIDEVQRAGDPILLAIKAQVDRDPGPGQFVLAGSTRFLTVPTLSESLAGRARILDLWPFSQGELEARQDRFVDMIFENPRSLVAAEEYPTEQADIYRRVCQGGFPEAASKQSEKGRSDWFEAYIRTVTQRDIKEIAKIHQAAELPRLLRLLAGLSGQELNVARLARRSNLDDQTLHNYLPLLETVYLVQRIPGWSRNLTSKVKRRPKVYLTDTGIASHLIGVNPEALSHPTSVASGPLLETFVMGELIKQRTWSSVNFELRHFRNRDGAEVDIVLESNDGRIVALEVKAAKTVDQGDFKWLSLMREKLGDAFVHGAVLYTGSRALSFGDRLSALPVPVLWNA